MGSILVVGLGGMVGAIARYGLSIWTHRRLGGAFPYGTLAVNVLGCLCIGVLFAWIEQRPHVSDQTRLLLATGVLGSFTTFSTFGLETVSLVQGGHARLAVLNVSVNLLLGLAAVLLGRFAAGAVLS